MQTATDKIKEDKQVDHDDIENQVAKAADNTISANLLNEIEEGEFEETQPIKLPYYEDYIKELKKGIKYFKKSYQDSTLSKESSDFIKDMMLILESANQMDEHKHVRVIPGSLLWQKIADKLQNYSFIQTYFTELGPLLRAIKGINNKYTKEKLAAEDIFEKDKRLEEKSKSNTQLDLTIKYYKRNEQNKGNHGPSVFDYNKMSENKKKYENLYEGEKKKHEACQVRENALKAEVLTLKRDNDFLNQALHAKGINEIVNEAKAITDQYAWEIDELKMIVEKNDFAIEKLEAQNSKLEWELSKSSQKMDDMAARIIAIDKKAKEDIAAQIKKANDESASRLELLSQLNQFKDDHNKEVTRNGQTIATLSQKVKLLEDENKQRSKDNINYALKSKLHQQRISSLDALVEKYKDAEGKLQAAENKLIVQGKIIQDKQEVIHMLTCEVAARERDCKRLEAQQKREADTSNAGCAGSSYPLEPPYLLGKNPVSFFAEEKQPENKESVHHYSYSTYTNCTRPTYAQP